MRYFFVRIFKYFHFRQEKILWKLCRLIYKTHSQHLLFAKKCISWVMLVYLQEIVIIYFKHCVKNNEKHQAERVKQFYFRLSSTFHSAKNKIIYVMMSTMPSELAWKSVDLKKRSQIISITKYWYIVLYQFQYCRLCSTLKNQWKSCCQYFKIGEMKSPWMIFCF